MVQGPRFAHGKPSSVDADIDLAKGISEANVLSAARSEAQGEVEGHRAHETTMGEAMNGFFIYVLHCSDGSYYVGSTTDVTARVAAHNDGRGPRFTACRRQVTLAYTESFQNMEQARKREVQIKKWSRTKKLALVEGDLTALHSLSRRRIR